MIHEICSFGQESNNLPFLNNNLYLEYMIDHVVTTNEIMDFLQKNMVTKEEFSQLNAKVDSLTLRLDNLTQRLMDRWT